MEKTYEVVVASRTRKWIKVKAEDEEKAVEIAFQTFSDLEDGTPEKYSLDWESIREIKEE